MIWRNSYSPEIVLSQMGLAWWVFKRVWFPSDGFHLVVQWTLMKIRQKCLQDLLSSQPILRGWAEDRLTYFIFTS